MATKIIGKGAFGTDSTILEAQSASKSTAMQEAVALDKDGNALGVALSQKTVEKTITVIKVGEAAPPEIGDVYDGGTVTAVTEDSSNSSFRQYTVTTKTWDDLGGGESAPVV